MNKLQTFMASALDDNLQVVLEVDMDKLTPALAAEVNSFWGDAERRVDAEDGDVVMAVIRLYGARLMALLLAEWRGVSITADRRDLALAATRIMATHEGWPPNDDTPHGQLGIRVVSAECELPGFDEVELSAGRVAA